MKRILFLSVIIICFWLFLNDGEQQTILVNNESTDESYQLYYLSFDNLNTKNFNEYFDSTFRIIAIYPSINPVYNNKVDNSIKYYRFNNYSNKQNIENFSNSFLGKMIFLNETEKYLINGIPIRIVKVYATNNSVYQLTKKHKDMEYSDTLNGSYKKMD